MTNPIRLATRMRDVAAVHFALSLTLAAASLVNSCLLLRYL